jgi:hypothetical protein
MSLPNKQRQSSAEEIEIEVILEEASRSAVMQAQGGPKVVELTDDDVVLLPSSAKLPVAPSVEDAEGNDASHPASMIVPRRRAPSVILCDEEAELSVMDECLATLSAEAARSRAADPLVRRMMLHTRASSAARGRRDRRETREDDDESGLSARALPPPQVPPFQSIPSDELETLPVPIAAPVIDLETIPRPFPAADVVVSFIEEDPSRKEAPSPFARRYSVVDDGELVAPVAPPIEPRGGARSAILAALVLLWMAGALVAARAPFASFVAAPGAPGVSVPIAR